jgi:4-hydroxythreonine-4-phosphate dehydrogenase
VIPTIAITMGDPGGIGPEVIVKALSDPTLRGKAQFLILGLGSCMERAAKEAGIAPYWRSADPLSKCESGPGVTLLDDEIGSNTGREATFEAADCARNGKFSLDWVERATKFPGVRAIVTGPVSKGAWKLAGENTPGHTGLIAARLGVSKYAMMFASPTLNVILVTDHVPLGLVPSKITPQGVRDTIELGHEAMQRLGVDRPRIAVCGLNPHAGEGGMLGDEDARLIQPGIEQAAAKGIDVQGPFPADTIFRRALHGPGLKPDFDLVVAMYHDQGLTPVKLLDRDRAVNVTVGLPIVRTSPDHGTAFDIAGKNKADPGSMRAAIELALRMVQGKGER